MTTTNQEQAASTRDTTRKLKAGVIGLGAGAMQVVRSLMVASNYELVAGADVRQQAVDAFEKTFNGRGYTSVEELCKDPDVDVVWISTPNQLHAEHTIIAAKYGKHIVVEKPMAVSLQQAESMIEAAEKNGVNLLCGHTASLMAGFRAMRRLISSGELGRVGALNLFSYNDWLFRPRMPAELDLAQGGGMPFRQGPHQFDVVRLMGGGMVKSVRGQVCDWMPFRGSPGYYVAYLEFEDGTPATVIKNGYGGFSAAEFLPFMQEPSRSRQSLNLRKSLRLGQPVDEEAGKEAMRFGGGREAELSTRPEGGGGTGFQMDAGIIIACCEKGDIRQSPEGLWIYDDDGQREVPVEGLRDERMAELDEMYQAVTQKRPVHHDGRWGMATLEVILAMLQSSQEHREVQLHHQVPAWE
jgi:phthalate 4,5-cis-dihydrodiol dehydrogenase